MIWTPLLAGIAGSMAAGLATGIGALPVLIVARHGARRDNALLGFAAGVMLVAAFFSLIAPGIALAEQAGSTPLVAALLVAGSVLAGAAGLYWLGRSLPALPDDGAGVPQQSALLLVLAIALHNLPEGAAVGVGFAGGNYAGGLATAIGIGIQNLPEGMAVAGALLTIGWSRSGALAGACATGLLEPVAGTLAAFAVAQTQALLPFAFGAAAGAMVHIVIAQIVPGGQAREGGNGLLPGFFAGFALMLVLDTALG